MKLCHSSTSRTLCEWLKESHSEICVSPFMVQVFWFFYAFFSQTKDERTNLESLQKDAPNLFYCSFNKRCFIEHLPPNLVLLDAESGELNLNLARKVIFLMKSLNENELTGLMNTFHQNKEKVVFQLDELYSDDLVLNSRIIPIGDKRFVFSLKDGESLTDAQYKTLEKLSANQTLLNPVFVSIDEEGRLIVD